MTPATPPAGRLPTIEILRGVASVAVVFHHIAQQTRGETLEDSAAGRLFLWLGGWGVALFFVLSGFCIHGSVLRGSGPGALHPGWRRYFIHRARRILPGYLTALALSAMLGLYGGSALISPPRWLDVLAHLTFTSGFSQDTALRINSVLWTVVVEVHFYLAYPLFVWCRNAIGMGRLTLLLLGLSTGIKLGGRLWLDAGGRWTWHHLFLNAWWVWALGALLAEMHAGRIAWPKWMRALNHRLCAVLIVAASLLTGCIDGRQCPTLWLVVESYGLPLLTAGVLAAAVFSPLASLRQPLLEFLGQASYSMYLFHPLALWMVVQCMPSSPLFVVLGPMLVLTGLFALAGYRLVERPFLRR